jgi:hypothetical protein
MELLIAKVRETAKSLLRKFLEIEYHRRHRRQALAILKSLEKDKGKISREEKLTCDAYARGVFGSKKYAPWLYVYTKNQGEFKPGWIPDNYYGNVVLPRIKSDYGKISAFKSLQQFILKSELLNDTITRINGQFFTPNLLWIDPANVKKILFKFSSQVVFKEDDSLQGLGVRIFDTKNFDLEDISKLGNGVFQPYIEQHAVLSGFNPGSVATLRITTTSHMGEVKIRGSYLRLGRLGDAHIKSASAIKVPVDTVTGCLSNEGFSPKLERLLHHPDSKIAFSGTVVPAFALAIKYVQELHAKVPFIGCVGWDLAIDYECKIRLLEWEGEHNDIKFMEATQGPMFRDLGWESFATNR